MLRLHILAFAAIVPLLARLPLARLHRLLRPRSRRRARSGDPERVIRYVEQAMRVPGIRHTCLIRGVTLYYCLTRAGEDVALCFGVGSVEGVLGAHCWLSRDGAPYLERSDRPFPFVPMHVIPAPAE
jgi:hypothetical protein